jgi:hypothetical protein
MGISDKTRKLLWGHSGNRCAICKAELVMSATAKDNESIVGDECHIISGEENGPRYDPDFSKSKIDSYSNLILLCRVHHKGIDDQSATYTAESLRQVKANHERWVSGKLNSYAALDRRLRIRRIKENIPAYLPRITTGKELLDIVAGACTCSQDYDELVSSEEVELVGNFLEITGDWGDLGMDFGPAKKVELGFTLSQMIEELDTAGFWVFAGKENQELIGQGQTTNWDCSIVRVVRKTNPEIVPLADLKKDAG